MKKLLTSLTVTVSSFALMLPAQAAQVTTNVGPNYDLDSLYRATTKADQNFSELYARVGDVPITECGWFPGESSAVGAANSNWQAELRRMCYIPPTRGALTVRLLMSNTAANSTATIGESDMPTGMLVNLGIETNVPAPWSPVTSYAVGATVTFTTGQYTALVPNAGVQPGALSTATWSSLPLTVPKAVTCGGVRKCGLGLQPTASGTNVPDGYFLTDPFPVNMPNGGWMAIAMYIVQPAGGAGVQNTINTGPNTAPLAGEFAGYYAGEGDLTLTGGFPLGATTGMPAPIVVGTPATPGPTACPIGDSISAGVDGLGLVYQSGTLTGGSGFTTADLNRIGTFTSANNPASVVNADAGVIITGVSGGAITTYALLNNGSYGNAISAGPYTFNMPGSAGTGASVSAFVTGSAHDTSGPGGTQGWLQRALVDNGIPFGAFAKSADQILGWNTRDYTRLANIRASGCSTAFIELGGNDVFQSVPAATLVARLQALAAPLKGLGTVKRVIASTLTTLGTTSTDGYKTAAGQTVNGPFNTIRAAYNQAIRAGIPGIDGFIDPATCEEVTPDSGIVKTDGVTNGLMTIADPHPSLTGHALIAACVSAQMKPLIASGAIR